ncbi:MAG: HAD family hydrolase [Clostridiales bacterium]|nr:HAD family hydrolase [Clostridiales bacterium]
MIKAAVFDLDHTLFDRYGTLRAIMPPFCARFDMSVSVEVATELMIEYDKLYVHTGWEQIYSHLVSKGVFRTAPTFDEYKEALLDEFSKQSVEYPFTKPMLTKLRQSGIKTGLITNGRSEIQRGKLRQLSLEPYLDEIIISGEIGFHKPSPEPFMEMAKRLSLEPHEIIFVGDNPETDITGARNAGFVPVWVATLGRWTIPEVEKTKYSVNDVSEIPDLINIINEEEKNG